MDDYKSDRYQSLPSTLSGSSTSIAPPQSSRRWVSTRTLLSVILTTLGLRIAVNTFSKGLVARAPAAIEAVAEPEFDWFAVRHLVTSYIIEHLMLACSTAHPIRRYQLDTLLHRLQMRARHPPARLPLASGRRSERDHRAADAAGDGHRELQGHDPRQSRRSWRVWHEPCIAVGEGYF